MNPDGDKQDVGTRHSIGFSSPSLAASGREMHGQRGCLSNCLFGRLEVMGSAVEEPGSLAVIVPGIPRDHAHQEARAANSVAQERRMRGRGRLPRQSTPLLCKANQTPFHSITSRPKSRPFTSLSVTKTNIRRSLLGCMYGEIELFRPWYQGHTKEPRVDLVLQIPQHNCPGPGFMFPDIVQEVTSIPCLPWYSPAASHMHHPQFTCIAPLMD